MSHVDEGQVSAYVDADASLTDSERQAIEAHVSGCNACRDLVDNARETHDLARSILGRSGPESISIPAFEDLVAISRQRTAKRKPVFTWTRGLAAAAVLVLAVSVGTFTGRGGPIPSELDTVEPVAFMDSADRATVSLQDGPIVRANENRAAPAVQTGLAGGAAADELASVSGAPSRTGAGQRQEPEPTAPLQRRAVAAELREDDAADAAAITGGRVALPAAAAELGEGVAPPVPAPPPALAADQRERFEAARALADTRGAAVESERAAQADAAIRDRQQIADCQASLEALIDAPVVLECARLEEVARSPVDGVGEVVWVTQTVDAVEISLAIVPTSSLTAELTDGMTEAILGRRPNSTGEFRARAAIQSANTISVTVGNYRVWLSGNLSEAELHRLATTLITAN